VPAPVSLRLPEATAEKIRHMASAEHRSIADMTKVLVEEAIKLREFPDIVFTEGPTGRRATMRNGLDVWEIVEPYVLADKNSNVLRESFPAVDEAVLRTALRYYEAYPAEIEALIALGQRGASRSAEFRPRQEAASRQRNVKHPYQFYEEFTSDPVVDEAMRRLAK
jgi:uncharacterized protein (DUF433 family)